MKNLLPPAVGSKLDHAHALLEQIARLLDVVARNTSPRAPAARSKTYRLVMSSLDVATNHSPPYPRNIIVGIRAGSDRTGRATINFGADSEPLYLLGNQTAVVNMTAQTAIEVPGGVALSFTPPTNATAWDVVLMIEPGGPSNEPA